MSARLPSRQLQIMWQDSTSPYNASRSICFAIALAVHAALLLSASSVRTPLLRTAALIRVSLQFPAEPSGDGKAAPPAAAPAPPAAPQVVAAPAPKPAIARPKAKAKSIAAKAASSPPVVAAVPDIVDANPAPVVPSASSEVAARGNVDGGAANSAAAAGAGGGHGSGTGSGSGGSNGGDQRGSCLDCPEPGYPMIARHRGWSGRVDVGLILLADGRVDSASVTRSSGYEILDQEALQVARRSRFRLPNPDAAPVRGHIEYRFELVQ